MPQVPQITQAPSAAELEVLRLNTKAFIAANPQLITLIPRTRTKSGTGVKWVDGTPRPAQIARMIEQVGGGAVVLLDGIQRNVNYQLLLSHDGQLGMYDYWYDADGIRNEVADLLPDNGYELRAQVVRYGE